MWCALDERLSSDRLLCPDHKLDRISPRAEVVSVSSTHVSWEYISVMLGADGCVFVAG